MTYFWYFLGYGFLGYLLEKLFAALTHAEHRVRKGFLLAPVCPVYGLAMCAVLALGADRIGPLWELALLCSITATTTEYAVHLFCDAVLGVRFWDYSATKTDVNGRICLPFSLAWGVLGALAVRLVQPALAALAAGIPSAVTNTVLLCLGIDALWSTGVLLRWATLTCSPRAVCGGNTGRHRKKRGLCPRFSFNRYAARSTPTDRRRPARGSPRSISRGAGRDRASAPRRAHRRGESYRKPRARPCPCRPRGRGRRR